MLKSAVTSMANFSRQTHINDPDQTALRGDSLGRNGPGEVSLLNKVPFNRFSNTSVSQQQLDNMYQPAWEWLNVQRLQN